MPPKRKGVPKPAQTSPYPPSATPASSIVPIKDIARNGDVILVIGPDRLRYRVSSTIMRNASEIFDVLFGPHFSEGQDLDVRKPKEIPLPEDDVGAMSALCGLIHLRRNDLATYIGASACLKIARLVDKYALCNAIYLPVDQWLTPPPGTSSEDLSNLLLAAELMDHDRGFDRITKLLITETTEPFHIFLSFPCEEESWVTWYMLERTRSARNARVIEDITLFGDGLMTVKDCNCQFVEKLQEVCSEIKSRYWLLRSKRDVITLDWLRRQILCIPDFSTDDIDMSGCTLRHTAPQIREWIWSVFELDKVNDRGLCLSCTRAGKLTEHETTGPCPSKAADKRA